MEILILGGCTLLFLLTGIILLYKNTQFVKNATKTTGEIVEYTSYMQRTRTMYTPIIEFKTFNNTTVKFPSPSSSNWKPKIGKTVNIVYHEENPEKAKLDSVFMLYILPVILIVLGLFLAFLTFSV
jgi:hypothetical protein